jgi:hypothetical protein
MGQYALPKFRRYFRPLRKIADAEKCDIAKPIQEQNRRYACDQWRDKKNSKIMSQSPDAASGRYSQRLICDDRQRYRQDIEDHRTIYWIVSDRSVKLCHEQPLGNFQQDYGNNENGEAAHIHILRHFDMPLPVAAEIHRWAALHCHMRHGAGLFAIGDAAIVFPP